MRDPLVTRPGAATAAMTRRPGLVRTAIARTGAGGAALAIAGFAVNALGYLVPVLGARQLTPGDLGALATTMAVAATASVAGLGLQTALAVRWARDGRVDNAGRVTAITAVAAAGGLAVAAPLLAIALDIPVVVLLLIAASTAAIVVASRSLGHLQGTERFGRLALGMVVLAVGRYGGVLIALLAGAGLTTAIAAGTATAWLVAGGLMVSDRLARPAADGLATAPASVHSREILIAGAATLAMLVVSSADLVLARATLSAEESGAYAVGSVLTKGALWAPQVVTLLVLPRLAQGRSRALKLALALVAASGIGLTLASLVAGRLAMGLAGGAAYQHLSGYAVGFAAVGALYALVFVLVNAELAAHARWPALTLWIGTVGLAVVVLVGRPGLAGVLTASVITAAGVAAATGVVALWRLRLADRAYNPGTVSPTEIALVQNDTDGS